MDSAFLMIIQLFSEFEADSATSLREPAVGPSLYHGPRLYPLLYFFSYRPTLHTRTFAGTVFFFLLATTPSNTRLDN